MLELLSLPDVVLEKILSYLTYDNIARYRIVSTRFDIVCQGLLNRGFKKTEKDCAEAILALRQRTPCNLPLAQTYVKLRTIQKIIKLLHKTFTKYIGAGQCCFFPGKVLDEINRLLRNFTDFENPAPDVSMQEMRDLSLMEIEPLLKRYLGSSGTTTPHQGPSTSHHGGRELKKPCTSLNLEELNSLKERIANLEKKVRCQSSLQKRIAVLEKRVRRQSSQLRNGKLKC